MSLPVGNNGASNSINSNANAHQEQPRPYSSSQASNVIKTQIEYKGMSPELKAALEKGSLLIQLPASLFKNTASENHEQYMDKYSDISDDEMNALPDNSNNAVNPQPNHPQPTNNATNQQTTYDSNTYTTEDGSTSIRNNVATEYSEEYSDISDDEMDAFPDNSNNATNQQTTYDSNTYTTDDESTSIRNNVATTATDAAAQAAAHRRNYYIPLVDNRQAATESMTPIEIISTLIQEYMMENEGVINNTTTTEAKRKHHEAVNELIKTLAPYFKESNISYDSLCELFSQHNIYIYRKQVLDVIFGYVSERTIKTKLTRAEDRILTVFIKNMQQQGVNSDVAYNMINDLNLPKLTLVDFKIHWQKVINNPNVAMVNDIHVISEEEKIDLFKFFEENYKLEAGSEKLNNIKLKKLHDLYLQKVSDPFPFTYNYSKTGAFQCYSFYEYGRFFQKGIRFHEIPYKDARRMLDAILGRKSKSNN